LPDIEKLLCTSKQMGIVSFAEANRLHLQSLQSQGNQRERLFQMSRREFEKAIKSNPSSKTTANLYADTLSEQAFSSTPIDFELLHCAVQNYEDTGNITAIKNILVRLYNLQIINNGISPKGSDTKNNNKQTSDAHRHLLQTMYQIVSRKNYLQGQTSLEFIANYCPQLIKLDLSGFTLDQNVLTQLATKCTSLHWLKLNRVSTASGESIALFIRNCKDLFLVELSELEVVTDATIKLLAKCCPSLHTLNISGCINVHNGIQYLSQLKALKSLDISLCCEITDLNSLGECKLLETIVCNGCYLLTDNSLKSIPQNCKNIYHLNMTDCSQLSDKIIKEFIHHCRNLENLILTGLHRLTDASLVDIRQCLRLRTIVLYSCDGISVEALRNLSIILDGVAVHPSYIV